MARVQSPASLPSTSDEGKRRAVVFALWEVYRHQAAFDFYKNTQHFAHLVVNGVRPLQRNAAR